MTRLITVMLVLCCSSCSQALRQLDPDADTSTGDADSLPDDGHSDTEEPSCDCGEPDIQIEPDETICWPEREACDGLDNDGDGVFDEGCACQGTWAEHVLDLNDPA